MSEGNVMLKVEGLSKAFGSRSIFSDVSFTVPRGATFALIGPSGCGKTTLLKTLAGLESADRGSIQLEDRIIDRVPVQRRHTVYLYQEPLLFPHLDVFENIAFGLRLRGWRTADIGIRVGQLLRELELNGLERRRPDALSGGQRQRVAFGRALIVQPALLLLDEPFSNLDPDTRSSMQELFRRVATKTQMTSVFVTHDLKESLRIGDRFGVLENGHLRLYGDRKAFCGDPSTGVQREMEFWRALQHFSGADRTANSLLHRSER